MKRFLFAISLFALPSITLGAVSYDLLAPIAGTTNIASLKDYLNLVFRAAIGITGVLAVVMMVICGVRLMGSPSVSAKSEAKECIWNAILGILLVLGAWLLLNTINPQLLTNDVPLADITTAPTAAPGTTVAEAAPTEPGWYFQYKDASGTLHYKAAGASSEACTKVQADATNAGVVITQPCFEIRTTPQLAGEDSTRTAICGNTSCIGSKGIPLGINRSACNSCGQRNCTNVNGLPGATISAIQSLQASVGTNVIITGGTECGHVSHAPGLPIFDLGRTATLVDFITKYATIKHNPSFNSGGVRMYKWLYLGYWYTDEGDHYHVCKDGTTYPGPEANKVAVIKEACNKM